MGEKENFCRFCSILLDVGAKVLLETFMDRYVCSSTLQNYLVPHKQTLSNLVVKNTLRQEQFDILYPLSGPPSIEKLDITLLCLMFRNLDKIKVPSDPVWTNPSPTDHSHQADVTRIRNTRNTMFGHVQSASMDVRTYNDTINSLKTIYKRLVCNLSQAPGRISKNELSMLIKFELNRPLQKDLESEIKHLLLEIEKYHKNDMSDSRSNFCRLFMLILNAGSHTLRCYFEKQYVANCNLEEFLSSKKTELEDLYKGNIINQKEKDLLSNIQSKPLLAQLTICLLTRLLTYLCEITPPICGWRKSPEAGDKSPGADILRLRNAKDNLVSRPDFSITEGEFHQEWFSVCEAISRLSNQLDQQQQNDIQRKIEDARKVDIDSARDMDKRTRVEIFKEVSKHKQKGQRDNNSGEDRDASGSSFVPSMDELSDEDDGQTNEDIQMPQGEEGKICIIKCYAILKLELEKVQVIDIAKNLFKKKKQKDVLEEMAKAGRRFCVDHLLKRVIREDAADLQIFFDLLKMKCRKIAITVANTKISDKDKTNFKQVSEWAKGTKMFPCRVKNGCNIEQSDIEFFQHRLLDVPEAVDEINDVLLSQFHFSICDHSQVTLCTVPEEKIRVLFEKIKSCHFESDKELQDVLESNLYNDWNKFKDNGSRHGLEHQGIWHSFLNRIHRYSEYIVDKFGGFGIRFIEAIRGSIVLKFVTLDSFDVTSLKTEPVKKKLRDLIKTVCPEYQDLLKEQVRVTIFLKPQRNTEDAEVYIHLETHSEVKEKEESSRMKIGSRDINYMVEEMNPASLKKWLFSKLQFHKQRKIQLDDLVSWKDMSRKEKMKILLSTIESLENGYELLEKYCEENDTLVYDRVFGKHRRLSVDGNVEGPQLGGISCEKGWGLQKLSSTWIDFTSDPKNEDLIKTVEANQKGTQNVVGDKDLKMTVDANQEETKKNTKGDDFEKAVGANQEQNQKHGKGQVIYNLYRDRQEKAILNETRKCLKALSKSQEDKKRDMMYLQDRQLEKSRQWDSLRRENQEVVIDGADIKYRSRNGESLLHTACLNGELHMVQLLQSKCPLLVHQSDCKGRSVCHSAAAGGSVNILNFLVQEGADPLCKDVNGMNLLHYACLEGKKEMAIHLLDTYSFMLYSVGKGGYTIPHCAAYGGSIDIFKRVCKLINVSSQADRNSHYEEKESQHSNQSDLEAQTETGETLLHMACLSGKLEMIQYLVERYPNMTNEVSKHEASLAHYAAAGGNTVSVLQYLIDQGLDPWCRTATQQTLLHLSCIGGQLEITQYLLEKYPDMINKVDNCNRTPAHYAAYSSKVYVTEPMTDQDLDQCCSTATQQTETATQQTLFQNTCIKNHLEIMKHLVRKYPEIISWVDNCNETAAHYAAVSGDISVLQYLIGIGLDPWCRASNQETLLHKSCMTCELEMIQYLVETYPDMINIVDSCKETPAHYAAQYSSVAVVQYLIDRGLDPWCRTAAQETLLHKSCIAGQFEMTQYLLEKYPDMVKGVDNCKRTAGHFAAQSSNISVLQYLIDQGLDPWCKTATEETLLHMSCIAGRLEMTQYLIGKYPEMINEVDKRKETSAHYAVQSNNVSVLQHLIDQGMDPWCRTATQETLLHVSSITGQLEMVKYLVMKYPDMINKVNNYKETPAHCAAYCGSISVLQYLIDEGLDPWCTSVHQQTVLHHSCIAGQLDMSKYLVEKYPDMINEVDSSKETPVQSAAYGGNISLLQFLVGQSLDPWCKSVQQQTLLHHSCIAGQLEMTQYLVKEYPAMINEVECDKKTPLQYAAQSSNVSLVQYLIDKGLDPWSRSASEETLLHISCIAGQLEMTQYLLEKYPDMINKVDNCKKTPLHYAAQSSNVSLVQCLIDKGLDPWCRTVSEESLLHKSCIASQLEMTQYLLEKYPDMINKVNNCKGTPLHYAAQTSNVSLVQYLIDQGLDPWCRTVSEQTLLHKSCIASQLEMTQYLLEKYPDMINKVDNCKETPLHYAAQKSNVSLVQYLIDQGLDPWCRTVSEETLLHKSCIASQLEMTQYLLEKYPDMINKVDNCKGTPLHYAAQSSNVSLVQYLIDKGLDPWCRTVSEESLLHKSCIASQLEMTQYLLEKYPDMINKVNNCKGTPLHYAAQTSNVSLVQYLIDQGLDPWCRTVSEQTLLHKSCIASQLEMTQYLLEKYPDMINKVDNCRKTPLHYAAQSNSVSLVQYLTEQGLDPWCRTASEETLIHNSCIAGQLEMTQYLVEKYPDMINKVDNCKGTPLHYAAQMSNVSLVQYLIEQGLDPWCRTASEKTLLHISCIAGQLEMTQYLVEKYPDMINKVDNCKQTPLHYAAQSNNVSLVQYLIDKGLDPSCETTTKQTLLHCSCSKGHLEMTKYLVEKYPDMIKKVDNCKETPLHYAAQSSNVSLVQYLINQGLDPWCRTVSEETLIHNSCIASQLEMTQYLLEKYPDMINKVNNCKGTPLHYAAQTSNVSLVQYLIDKGLDPWCRTASEETLLHRSCIAGQLKMTQYLVEKYPDMINKVNNCNGTAAHYAVLKGNISVLQYLVNQGLDPWCITTRKQTLLHMSCGAGQLEMSEYLVETYPDMINKVDSCKRTSGHDAAQSGNVSIIQYLIRRGLDPLCTTVAHQTLLHISSRAGKLEMSRYLLEKFQGKVNKVDNRNQTPLHYAAQSSNVSVLQYLIDQGLDPWCRTATKETLLHKSSIAGVLEVSNYLVGKYPDMMNKVDNCKRTPAHYAAQSSNVSVLQYLIDQGMDPWCRTASNETLLHMACIAGKFEMTQYLVEKYPDMINKVNNSNGTPGHYAAQSGNVSILEYLIDKGLDPLCRTATQETLLHRSSNAGQLEMSKYLVEKYPDMISEVDYCNETPAHYAAQRSNVSVLHYLIDKGMDPWFRTTTQDRLLHKSQTKGQLEMTKYLVEKYPDMINKVDSYKRTPAHYAAQSGFIPVLQYLIEKGLDPWCRTSTQETLLHRSSNAGQLEMSKYLVENYPNMINEVDSFKRTAGHYAAQSRNVSVLLPD